MKTFGCNPSVNAFARFYELVIIPEVINASDGQFYHTQHACCTFNTRRQNTRKGITRIQIAPCCKTNLTDDWNSHWFYLKVNMSEVSGYTGPAHPLTCPIAPLTAVNTAEFNHRAVEIRNCESAFHFASTILGGRDIIEEFVAARIWPISNAWAPIEIVYFNVNWAAQEVPFPKFGIKLHENQSADAFMIEIEKRVRHDRRIHHERIQGVQGSCETQEEDQSRVHRGLRGQVFQFSRSRSQAKGSHGCRGQLSGCPYQCPTNKVFEARLVVCQ
jgi:hypothetical protein